MIVGFLLLVMVVVVSVSFVLFCSYCFFVVVFVCVCVCVCLLLGGGGEGDVLPFIANMPGQSDRVHRCRVHSKRTVKGRDARKVTSKQG